MGYDIHMKKYRSFVLVQMQTKWSKKYDTDTKKDFCGPVALKYFSIILIGEYGGKVCLKVVVAFRAFTCCETTGKCGIVVIISKINLILQFEIFNQDYTTWMSLGHFFFLNYYIPLTHLFAF